MTVMAIGSVPKFQLGMKPFPFSSSRISKTTRSNPVHDVVVEVALGGVVETAEAVEAEVAVSNN